MVEHRKRRRRRKPEVEEETSGEVGRRKRFRARKPVVKEVKRPAGIRPIYRIALNLFEAHPDFALDNKKNKVYQEFRELFCIAYADQSHQQTGENAEPIKLWTGREIITNWLEATKSMRKKAVKVLQAELAQHLEYLEE